MRGLGIQGVRVRYDATEAGTHSAGGNRRP